MGRAVSQIGAAVNEAERVTQVNQGLAYYERAFQEYQQSLATRSFEVSRDEPDVTEIGGAPAADWSGMVQRPLGQVTQADLDADYTKFVNSQVEYVQKNFRNKGARQELLQHLQMGAIANHGKAIQTWQVASDHEATASLNNLYGVVMASDATPDEKIGRISVRVDEMVRTGRMWKDTGETIKQKAQDTARYSFAYNGAMETLKQTGDLDQADAWLSVNTPFYEGNPDARAKVFGAVRDEYQIMEAKETKAVREQLSLKNTDYLTRFGTLTEAEVLHDNYLVGKGSRGEVAAFTEKWVDAIRQLAKTDPEKIVPTLAESQILDSIYRNRQFDNPMVGEQISIAVERGTLRAAVAKKYVYDRMDDRKWIIRSEVSAALDTMAHVYDERIKQEKDAKKQGELLRRKISALDELHSFLGQGPHTDAEIASYAKRLGNEEVAQAMKDDFWNPTSKTPVDERRTRALAGEGYTTEERAAYEYNDRNMLTREYGLGKEGKGIIETQFDSAGMAQYRISGLNPKQPGKSFWYRFETDPTSGTERLMVYEAQVNARNEVIGGRWTPSGLLSPGQAEAAARASAAANVPSAAPAAAAQAAQTVQAAGPQARVPLTSRAPKDLSDAELDQALAEAPAAASTMAGAQRLRALQEEKAKRSRGGKR